MTVTSTGLNEGSGYERIRFQLPEVENQAKPILSVHGAEPQKVVKRLSQMGGYEYPLAGIGGTPLEGDTQGPLGC